MSKYELSRIVSTYECQRESLAFFVYQKMYNVREEGAGIYCSDFYSIVENKKLKRYLALIDKLYNDELSMTVYCNSLEKLDEMSLFKEDSPVIGNKANEHYIVKLTRIMLRKEAVKFLKKRGCKIIEKASNEKQYNTGFILSIEDLVELHLYLRSKLYNKDSEFTFNKFLKKMPAWYYKLDETKFTDVKPTEETPIPFTNVIDENDYAKTCDAFLWQLTRIRKVYDKIELKETGKSSIIWFI